MGVLLNSIWFVVLIAVFYHYWKKDKREAAIQGRGPVGKAIVAGLLERSENGSRVITDVVADRTAATLQKRVREYVDGGSEVITDEWVGYEGLNQEYIHSVINHAVKYVEGHVHTNGMENFWTLFKRAIKGTYVSVEAEHLFRYLDEEEFRFNERKGKNQDRFVKLLSNLSGKRLTYAELIDKGDELVGRRGPLPKLTKQAE